jgi:hypothetical protein
VSWLPAEQLRNIRRNPPRFIFTEQLGCPFYTA